MQTRKIFERITQGQDLPLSLSVALGAGSPLLLSYYIETLSEDERSCFEQQSLNTYMQHVTAFTTTRARHAIITLLINAHVDYTTYMLSGTTRIEDLEHLATLGCNRNVRDGDTNGLHTAVLTTHPQQAECINFFLTKPNACLHSTGYQNTPLHTLIANESTSAALFYLATLRKKRIPDCLHEIDCNGRNPLHLAVVTLDDQVATDIIIHRHNDYTSICLDAQDKQGNTALHYACLLGMSHTVKLLLAAGANAELANHAGITAFNMIDKTSSDDVSELLQSVAIKPDRDEHALKNEMRSSYCGKLPIHLDEYNQPKPIHIPATTTSRDQVSELLHTSLFTTCYLYYLRLHYYSQGVNPLEIEMILGALWGANEFDLEYMSVQMANFSGKSLLTAILENRAAVQDWLAGPRDLTASHTELTQALEMPKDGVAPNSTPETPAAAAPTIPLTWPELQWANLRSTIY